MHYMDRQSVHTMFFFTLTGENLTLTNIKISHTCKNIANKNNAILKKPLRTGNYKIIHILEKVRSWGHTCNQSSQHADTILLTIVNANIQLYLIKKRDYHAYYIHT